MNALSRRQLVARTAVLAGIGAIGAPALAQLSAEIVVPNAPPGPRVEVIPEIPLDRREREYWQPGYWKWSGQTYDWYEGRYVVRPRAGAVWIPGHWERRNGGWFYVDGHWT